jgi:hypothetical protein
MRAADHALKDEERTDACPRLASQIVSEQPIAQNSQMWRGKGSTSDKQQRVARALERPPQPLG